MHGEDAYRDYVRARLPSLTRVAFLLTGDRHLAEDLVQTALIKLARHWERVSHSGAVDPYVRKMIYHEHVSWWRRRHAPVAPFSDLPDLPVADSTSATVTSLAVRQALARLAPRQRAVLVLRYFEDLTEAQAAEALGCSVGTVKSQARDALARLRRDAPELADLGGPQSKLDPIGSVSRRPSADAFPQISVRRSGATVDKGGRG